MSLLKLFQKFKEKKTTNLICKIQAQIIILEQIVLKIIDTLMFSNCYYLQNASNCPIVENSSLE